VPGNGDDFCSLFQSTEEELTPGLLVRPVTKPLYDVHYGDGRTSIVLEADLERGWTKLQKTYGFFRQTRIPYRNDVKIRAQLSVIAQPASVEPWAQDFPDIEAEGNDSELTYELRRKHLIVKVSLLPSQPWRTTQQGRPELYVERLSWLPIDEQHWIDLRAWIVFHEGTLRRIPDVRVWAENNLVVPGGQFESSRRHH
jgi:hypothetical protein